MYKSNMAGAQSPALPGVERPAGFTTRERVSINEGWKFMRYTGATDSLLYDVRPEVTDRNDNVVADAKPTESVALSRSENVLKKWILPTANE